MAKIRIIERNHRRRMKITLTSQREVEWLTAIFNNGNTITSNLYDRGIFPNGSARDWNTLQFTVFQEFDRAAGNTEH